MKLFYCDHYAIPLPPGHKFPMAKYALIRELLAADGFYHFECAPLADPTDVKLAHDAEYVDAFVNGTLSAQAIRRIGFPWSEGLVKRSLASVGGTLGAAEDALESGFGGNLAGGTHHAFRAEGSGFCVFNDIAVSIEWLRSQGRIRRAAVIDVDVHQGDGTAHIFENDPNVLTASVHCGVNFPFRKQRSKIDVELPEGTEDDAYLEALHPLLPRVLEFGPEVVFYQSGVDTLASDSLGRLKLTHQGLKQRDRMVMRAVHRRGIPFVVTLGGGYSKPIELTALAHANTFRIAAEIWHYQAAATSEPSCAGLPKTH
jgi:acetoin utilization deacetylase AcuC-like enzyme